MDATGLTSPTVYKCMSAVACLKKHNTMFSLEIMHISVQKDDKAVYAAHHQFISSIQNVSISLVNMQITEINRCDCVYCFIGIL